MLRTLADDIERGPGMPVGTFVQIHWRNGRSVIRAKRIEDGINRLEAIGVFDLAKIELMGEISTEQEHRGG